MKTPSTYIEWHRLYHDAFHLLGMSAATYFSFRYMGAFKPGGLGERIDLVQSCPQRVYRNHQRLKRIERRLDEARERGCPTFFRHIMAYGFPPDDMMPDQGHEPLDPEDEAYRAGLDSEV